MNIPDESGTKMLDFEPEQAAPINYAVAATTAPMMVSRVSHPYPPARQFAAVEAHDLPFFEHGHQSKCSGMCAISSSNVSLSYVRSPQRGDQRKGGRDGVCEFGLFVTRTAFYTDIHEGEKPSRKKVSSGTFFLGR
jgi:hypothetical protein